MRLSRPIPKNYNELRRNTWKYIPTWHLNKKYGIFLLKKKFNIKVIAKKNGKSRNIFSQKKKSKLRKRKIGRYNLTITITNNNTFINFSKISYKMVFSKKNKKTFRIKNKNKTLIYTSGGLCGFVGSQKCTPEANTTMAINVANKINNILEKKKKKGINIFLKGRKRRAKTIIKQLVNSGLLIKAIKKITPYPHNGCRAKKKRRL